MIKKSGRTGTSGLMLGAAMFIGAGSMIGSAPADSANVAALAVGTGDVQGTVTLNVGDEPAPTMLSPYARRRYAPPAAAGSSDSPENVIVYIVVRGQSSRPTNAVIHQRNRTILPQAAVVQLGGRIDFPNDDSVFHNLFSLSETKKFNLGRYAPGASKSETFDKPGVVRLFCDIHSDMSATILVVDTPFFTRPDQAGNFRLRGIPEGRHTIVAWHESTGPVSKEIVVSNGDVTRADIRIGA